MSRVGKHPVQIPSGVSITIDDSILTASGKLGKQMVPYTSDVLVTQEDSQIFVKPANDSQRSRAMWGTIQRQIKSAVHGVSEGATVNLELSGVGYRASVQGSTIVLQLGFSHDIKYPIPQGVTVKCDKPTTISITSASKQEAGQIAAELRKYRKPEPYKGKGVIRDGEFVLRKEGKKK
jgi:large subunit ribosomal protein L6